MRFRVDGSEAMRIDSSGNLHVGKTATGLATAGLSLRSDVNVAQFTRDGGDPLNLNRLTSDGDIVGFYKDGTIVGSIFSYNGFLGIGSPSGNDAYVIMGSDFVAPATSSGAARDNAIDLGSSSRRFKDLYLSGGVYVGGTGSANYLDDYEEGSWTVDLRDSSGNSATSINGNGRYIKVGNLVTVWGRFSDPDLTGLTSTDDVRISGLPFTASGFTGDAMNFIGSVRMENVDFASSPDGYVNTNIAESGTYIRLVETRNNAIDDFIVVSQISATSEMYFTATYPTTAF
jgi:hypothetical protein